MFASFMKHALVFAVGIGLIGWGSGKPAHDVEIQHPKLPFPVAAERLKYLTFGYNENISDSLWIRLVQDLYYCHEGPESTDADGPTTPEEYQGPELLRPDRNPKQPLQAQSRCKKGWVFQFLDAITQTSPRFRMPYVAGGTSLSIAIGDREGATIIFDRGVKQFPTDWSLAYRAAYHALYEVHDAPRAAELLIQAGRNGAPGWVISLAAKVYSRSGRAELGKRVLEDAIAMDPESPLARRFRERLEEINRELEEARKEEK